MPNEPPPPPFWPPSGGRPRLSDIGPLPDIADPPRRSACARSLELFCRTYLPDWFTRPFTTAQLALVGRVEAAVTVGGAVDFDLERGAGNTTLCLAAALWAVSGGTRRRVLVVREIQVDAEAFIGVFKVSVRFGDHFAADFPDVAYPVRHLNGIAGRAGVQTCVGEPTRIGWGDRQSVILPTVRPPANWLPDWPLRADGTVPSAGAALLALSRLGLGERMWADLVLIDAPHMRIGSCVGGITPASDHTGADTPFVVGRPV